MNIRNIKINLIPSALRNTLCAYNCRVTLYLSFNRAHSKYNHLIINKLQGSFCIWCSCMYTIMIAHSYTVGCRRFLQFCTGSRMVPPLGFRNSKITVSITSTSAIQVSTCFQSLRVPNFESYELLCSAFNSVIFGDNTNSNANVDTVFFLEVMITEYS